MKALDLFCGAGGAAMGLHRAGFEVIGIDVVKQPRYPFGFVEADALTYPLHGAALIWASPPCQRYCSMVRASKRINDYPDLIDQVRARLALTDAVWVIENVPRAPIRTDLLLCGSMFRLPVRRHRIFEFSSRLTILQPTCLHSSAEVPVYGREPSAVEIARGVGRLVRRSGSPLRGPASVDAARAAMGIDWMNWKELTQAIPPSYSEFIGRAAMRALAMERAG